MSDLFDVPDLNTETLKDIFKNHLEGFSKTLSVKGMRYPRSVIYTISKGELIITDLEVEPYKPSVTSRLASPSEIWGFYNEYWMEMEDYYETFRK